MKKTDYPERIYASKYVNRHEGDPYGDFYLENENELCVEYVRTDLVPRWHDASKELPEDAIDVVADNGEEYAVASLWKMANGTSIWVTPTDGYNTKKITAWMEIPEPYKEE